MKIQIYQIREEKDKRNLLFMSYKFAQQHGGVDPNEYERVFSGDVGTQDLEEIFLIFNLRTRMPDGYHGRKLSISDVVVTEDGAFFCDSFGFVEIDEFKIERKKKRRTNGN